jgi:hypothetical protein
MHLGFGMKIELCFDSELVNSQWKFWLLKKELEPCNEVIEAFTDIIPAHPKYVIYPTTKTFEHVSSGPLSASYGNCQIMAVQIRDYVQTTSRDSSR